MKVVIVGGVAGGATCAARLRRLDEHASIIVFERSGYVSYANCGLPYYVGGVITDRAKLTLQTPESFKRRFDIDVRVLHEVVSIDRKAKAVRVRDLSTGEEFDEGYDKLVLAPGAVPVVPPIPGVDAGNVFTLRTVEDTFAIDDYVREHAPQRAVVVGGGFIGLETAENLSERGVAVTVLQRPDHLMPTLDRDMAAILRSHLVEHGIDVRLGVDVVEVECGERGECGAGGIGGADPTPGARPACAVLGKDGASYPADMVIMAVGVRPDSSLAKDAGLTTGARGAIVVDGNMLTSDPDIYAVGDAVLIDHAVLGQPSLVSLAGPANKQARLAADHICGIDRPYRGATGSSIMKAFDLTVASTGITMGRAQAEGLDADYVVIMPPSHATYYPGSVTLVMKVVFEKSSGRILGAQIIGADGVEARIDVLATAIQAGMGAGDLAELDLAYAPPYSSAKDPVNMAGFVIENILDGLVRQIHWEQFAEYRSGRLVLDTRTAGEFGRGHIAGAVNIPVDELRDRVCELDRATPVLVYCQSALRSYIACRILSQEGFDCVHVGGGYGYYDRVFLKGGVELDVEGVGPCGAEA